MNILCVIKNRMPSEIYESIIFLTTMIYENSRVMSIFDRFAEKYYMESLKDLERARKALRYEDYPQAVFYAQQTVEKSVKAMLEAKRRVIYNHGPELISIFVDVFENEWEDEFEKILGALEYLTEYYTRSRYPFLLRGEVIGPEDVVTKEIAEKGLSLAERTVEVVGNYLRRRNII